LPDLIIQNPVLTLANNGNYQVNYDIFNTGSVVAKGDFSFESFFFYLASGDAILDKNDTQFLSRISAGFGPLCPQQAFSVFEGAINIPPGTNYLIVEINQAQLDKVNFNNNWVAIPVTGNNTVKKQARSEESAIHINDISLTPNPLVDQGLIRYFLDKESLVSISIYSMTGKAIQSSRVKSVLSESIQEEGIHEVPVNRSGLRPGLYLINSRIDGNRFIRKLLIE